MLMADVTATPEMVTDKGLDRVIIGDSTKSFIDGVEGVLEYVGIDIDDLARNSTFEECCYLLWYDRLPTASELDSFAAEIRSHYGLSDQIKAMVKATP